MFSEQLANVALTILTAGGGGAVVAFTLFRFLGKAWLESKFAAQLESFRSEKAKEFEQFRSDLDGLKKSQERYRTQQLEGIESIWIDLKDAQTRVLATVSMIQSYPDIRWAEDERRKAVFDRYELEEWQVRSIMQADDQQDELRGILDRKRFAEAGQAFARLDTTTRRFELFFDEGDFQEIRQVLDKLHDVLVHREIYLEVDGNSERRKAWELYDQEFIPMSKELTKLFRSRWQA